VLHKIKLCLLNEIPEKTPFHCVAKEVDLVVIKDGGAVSVLYGRCQHRGALLADEHIEGKKLIVACVGGITGR